MLEPLASAKLPEFKCIDISRRNRLLLTFPHSRYAVYMIKDHQFCSMEQPAISDKVVRMLKDAEHAILSQDSKLVVQAESSVMCHNKAYSFKDRCLSKVHIFGGNWMTLSQRRESRLNFEIIQEKDERTIHDEKDLSLDSVVVPSDAYGGIAVLYKTRERLALGGFSSSSRRVKEICISREGSVYSKEPVELRPEPQNMISAAVMKKVLFLLVNETTIVLYVMKKRINYNVFFNNNDHEDMANRMNEIHLQDLGLTMDCKLQRIWAGGTESGIYMLHVLYQKGHDKILASYNMDKDFLKRCEGNNSYLFGDYAW